jgi:hypothetical protein
VTFTPLTDQTAYVIKPKALDAMAIRSRVEHVMATHRRAWVIGQSTRSFASSPEAEKRLLTWLTARYGEIGRFDFLTGGDPAIRVFRGGHPATR